MVLTDSTMQALGTKLPSFSLPDVVGGKVVTSEDFKNKSVFLVMFICSHCPYVVHVEKELAKIGSEYEKKQVGIVAISSNDSDYEPEDSPEGLKKQAERLGFNFPYLYDESQKTAKDFKAACTPDFFLYAKSKDQGGDFKLVYRGQLDDSRPGMGETTGGDLRKAMDQAIEGSEVDIMQKPSSGCNIKWKS